MREKCIVCLNQIYRSDNESYRGPKVRRKPDSVTCCKKCSRIYTRVHKHVYATLIRKVKK